MNSQFMRKLDLLNRIYLVNSGQLAALDHGPVTTIPDLQPSNSLGNYFNLADFRLLIFALPRRKVQRVFRRLVLNELGQDPGLKLNAPLLKELKSQLSPAEFKCLMQATSRSDHSRLSDSLLRYGLSPLVDSLIHVFLTPLVTAISEESLNQRFPALAPNFAYSSLELDALLAESKVSAALTVSLPQTSLIVEYFLGK